MKRVKFRGGGQARSSNTLVGAAFGKEVSTSALREEADVWMTGERRERTIYLTLSALVFFDKTIP